MLVARRRNRDSWSSTSEKTQIHLELRKALRTETSSRQGNTAHIVKNTTKRAMFRGKGEPESPRKPRMCKQYRQLTLGTHTHSREEVSTDRHLQDRNLSRQEMRSGKRMAQIGSEVGTECYPETQILGK